MPGGRNLQVKQLKNWSDFFSNGFIGHKYQYLEGFDFGDSTQRLGLYHIGLELRNGLGLSNRSYPNNSCTDFIEALNKLEDPPNSGLLKRHTDIPYNQTNDWSRDQEIPIIIALGLYSLDPLIKRMLLRHIKQFPMFQNKDVITWEWALYFRALNWKWTYPLLLILDLGLVVNSILRLLKGLWNKDDVDGDLNHSLCIIFCCVRYQTPLSRFAKFIYKFRPKPLVVEGHDDVNNILLAWRWYFRQPEAPPFDDLFEPIIRHYL